MKINNFFSKKVKKHGICLRRWDFPRYFVGFCVNLWYFLGWSYLSKMTSRFFAKKSLKKGTYEQYFSRYFDNITATFFRALRYSVLLQKRVCASARKSAWRLFTCFISFYYRRIRRNEYAFG
jgi:hypothetical protein